MSAITTTGKSSVREVKVSIAYTCDTEIENVLKGFSPTWTIWNAPRPLYGTTIWQGKFLAGMFWGAINTESEWADWQRVENIGLAASLVKFVPMDEAKRVVQASRVTEGYSIDDMDWMTDTDYWREFVALMPQYETQTIPV
jgi:hypothetical protein